MGGGRDGAWLCLNQDQDLVDCSTGGQRNFVSASSSSRLKCHAAQKVTAKGGYVPQNERRSRADVYEDALDGPDGETRGIFPVGLAGAVDQSLGSNSDRLPPTTGRAVGVTPSRVADAGCDPDLPIWPAT